MESSTLTAPTNENLEAECIPSTEIEAFNQIYTEYASKLYSFTYSYIKDHDQSQDLVQEVLTTVWEKRNKICCDYKFSNYLFSICYNAILKHFRAKKTERQFINYTTDKTEQGVSATLDTINYNEMASIVSSAIDKLPEKRRQVFKLSREEGKNTREIAELLEISPRTVETHISKALASLRVNIKRKIR